MQNITSMIRRHGSELQMILIVFVAVSSGGRGGRGGGEGNMPPGAGRGGAPSGCNF